MGIETFGGQLAFAEKGVVLYFSKCITKYTRKFAECIGNILRAVAICTYTPKQKIYTRRNIVTGDFLPLWTSNCIASIGLIEAAGQSTPTLAKMVCHNLPIEPP